MVAVDETWRRLRSLFNEARSLTLRAQAAWAHSFQRLPCLLRHLQIQAPFVASLHTDMAWHAPGTSVGGGISCRVGASPSSGWRSSSSFGMVARGSPAPAACIGCTVLRQERMERSLQVATYNGFCASNWKYRLAFLQLVPSGCQLQVCAAAADETPFCYLLSYRQVSRFSSSGR